MVLSIIPRSKLPTLDRSGVLRPASYGKAPRQGLRLFVQMSSQVWWPPQPPSPGTARLLGICSLRGATGAAGTTAGPLKGEEPGRRWEGQRGRWADM